MWVLDTDHLTILERKGAAALPLQIQLRQVPLSEVGTTVVNYEEQMRGWLAQAAQANTIGKMIEAYALLE